MSINLSTKDKQIQLCIIIHCNILTKMQNYKRHCTQKFKKKNLRDKSSQPKLVKENLPQTQGFKLSRIWKDNELKRGSDKLKQQSLTRGYSQMLIENIYIYIYIYIYVFN